MQFPVTDDERRHDIHQLTERTHPHALFHESGLDQPHVHGFLHLHHADSAQHPHVRHVREFPSRGKFSFQLVLNMPDHGRQVITLDQIQRGICRGTSQPLVGDFGKALREVKEQFQPDRILIEPSGVGKLSDVIVAVENTVADIPDMRLNSFVTVADAGKVKVYMKNFGEFYNNQIESAGAIILSRTQKVSAEKLTAAVALLREHNKDTAILPTPWDELDGKTILAAMEKVSLADELMEKIRAEHEADEHEHHHHHDHDDDCCCGHDHDHEHHHDHDEDEEHEHHHHHDHDDDCCCGHDHDHEHHHHHHADEVFTSWGMETIVPVTKDQLEDILKRLAETKEFGDVLRAKGMLPTENPGEWLYFDLVPEQYEIRDGKPDYTGKVCVIGASLKEEELNKVFGRG